MRQCHMNFDNLVRNGKMKKVRGLPRMNKLDNVMCKQCQIGKTKKSSFKRKTYTCANVLEFIHTNLYGPIGIQIYCDNKYIILFVDDQYRMMIVIFLKQKFDALQLIKWYLGSIEREIGKILKSNRGAEFISNQFNIF